MRKTKPASTRASAEARNSKNATPKKADRKAGLGKAAKPAAGKARRVKAGAAGTSKAGSRAQPAKTKTSSGSAARRSTPAKRPVTAKATKAGVSRRGTRAAPGAKAKARPTKAGASKKALAVRARKRASAHLQKVRDAAKALRARTREKERLAREKKKASQVKASKATGGRKKSKLKRTAPRKVAAKQKERQLRQRENERLLKERERAARDKERAREAKQRDAERRARKKTQELERKRQKAERDAAKKAREQDRKRREAEREHKREATRRERELARVQQKAEREAARIAEKKAREEDRVQKQQERDRLKEEARRIKEEERALRDKERDEYRRAKDAEKDRLRAEREAARRALEGKVARANKSAQRAAGLLGRGSTTRLYRPSAIPDQSRTTRRLEGELAQRLAALRSPALPRELVGTVEDQVLAAFEPASAGQSLAFLEQAPPQPVTAGEVLEVTPADAAAAAAAVLVPQSDLIEERNRSVIERLTKTPEDFRRAYQEELDMSWIYHDSALEGVVYTFQELKTAIDPNIVVVPDSSLQPVCEEIRRHKTAIDLVRELAEKKRLPITVDTIKKIYLTLHPEEGDIKTVKYRRDIPQHRLYFHEYAPPDKIAYKVRQVIDWLNGPEPKKLKSPLKIAARAHYDLVRVFPFAVDSGKVARLLMNLILLRSDYPPAIVHSTERQRYYEALKGQLPIIIQMVTEAIQNGLFSVEKKLEEQETRMRSFVS